jgi:TrmH family RNA methyltransferase
VLKRAVLVRELPEALGEVTLAVGTSARLGGKRVSAGAPSEIVPLLLEQARQGPVACVFGRESRGLTNEELKLCTHHLIIPTDERFASMNVAHAAAVVCSEIYARACRPSGFQVKRFKPASTAEREAMYDHIESVLVRAGFLEDANPLRMMRDLRRILNSAAMDQRDVKIVRGIFRKMANMVRIADERVRDLEAQLGDGSAAANTEC